MAREQKNAGGDAAEAKSGPEKCGIIMPIAGMPGYEAEHWAEVLSILSRAIVRTGRDAEPVWAGGAADIIQERIVRNLYELPIAICDISGLNSNVMLELGMRLAFGKPTIIVTDGLLKPPFDIGAIEYLPYPRDLHILKTEKFVEDLAARIELICSRVADNAYRPFIKTFGPIEAGSPGTDAIPLGQAVLDQLEQLSATIRRLERPKEVALAAGFNRLSSGRQTEAGAPIVVGVPLESREIFERDLAKAKSVASFGIIRTTDREARYLVTPQPDASPTLFISELASVAEHHGGSI